jgi:hypothetical protein
MFLSRPVAQVLQSFLEWRSEGSSLISHRRVPRRRPRSPVGPRSHDHRLAMGVPRSDQSGCLTSSNPTPGVRDCRDRCSSRCCAPRRRIDVTRSAAGRHCRLHRNADGHEPQDGPHAEGHAGNALTAYLTWNSHSPSSPFDRPRPVNPQPRSCSDTEGATPEDATAIRGRPVSDKRTRATVCALGPARQRGRCRPPLANSRAYRQSRDTRRCRRRTAYDDQLGVALSHELGWDAGAGSPVAKCSPIT